MRRLRGLVVAAIVASAPMVAWGAPADAPAEQESRQRASLPAPWVPALAFGVMVLATALLALQGRKPRERVIRRDR